MEILWFLGKSIISFVVISIIVLLFKLFRPATHTFRDKDGTEYELKGFEISSKEIYIIIALSLMGGFIF